MCMVLCNAVWRLAGPVGTLRREVSHRLTVHLRWNKRNCCVLSCIHCGVCHTPSKGGCRSISACLQHNGSGSDNRGSRCIGLQHTGSRRLAVLLPSVTVSSLTAGSPAGTLVCSTVVLQQTSSSDDVQPWTCSTQVTPSVSSLQLQLQLTTRACNCNPETVLQGFSAHHQPLAASCQLQPLMLMACPLGDCQSELFSRTPQKASMSLGRSLCLQPMYDQSQPSTRHALHAAAAREGL